MPVADGVTVAVAVRVEVNVEVAGGTVSLGVGVLVRVPGAVFEGVTDAVAVLV